jgi:hypothetical protein
MGKISKSILIAVAVLCSGAVYFAKADSFTPSSGTGTSAVFTGVKVYNDDKDSVANPFGLTDPGNCRGNVCNENVFGTDTSLPFEVATITFFSNGGFTLTPTTGGSGNSSNVGDSANTSLFAVSGTPGCASATSLVGSASSAGLAINASPTTECLTAGSWTLNGNPQSASTFLTYDGSGTFDVLDTSIHLAFSLTPTSTPEPSSLLMLGSGLLGLIGFGLRRRGIA